MPSAASRRFRPTADEGRTGLVLHALETADVGIMAMTPQPGELGARMAIVKVVERRQIRYAHMVGVTPEIMQQGMRADYKMSIASATNSANACFARKRSPFAAEAGTTIDAHFDRGLDWVKTSGLISPRYWSNLPAGEVFTTPATVDGTFVCDATAGDHFNGKYGDLQSTPLTLKIENARLVEVHCERKDLEQEFWDYCHTDENSDRIGESPSAPTSAFRNDRNLPPGRKISRRPYRLRGPLRQPDPRRLEIQDPRRRPNPEVRRLDRLRTNHLQRQIPTRPPRPRLTPLM